MDTSVWSLSLRRKGPLDHPAVRRLSNLLSANEDVFLTGLVLQEVLQAYRSEATFKRLLEYLKPFPLLDLDRSDYAFAANLHRRCAARGIATATADCQIAAAAIRRDCLLLTADRDFERIARICDLVLL